MLTVTTPATNLQLLDQEQLRLAAGLAKDDSSRDEDLAKVGLRIAAEIATACRIRIGAGAPPTLKRELVTQTFRGPRLRELILDRRHEVAITSVAVDGTALTEADFEVEPEAGLLYRLNSSSGTIWWHGRSIVVVYEAGFDEVPADLAAVASDLMRYRIASGDRDPLIKSESTEVPDVLTQRVDYWVGAVPGSTSGPVPAEYTARLSRFMNWAMA